MSEPRGLLKPVSDPTHQGASLPKPRSYQGRRPTFRMRDNRGNTRSSKRWRPRCSRCERLLLAPIRTVFPVVLRGS